MSPLKFKQIIKCLFQILFLAMMFPTNPFPEFTSASQVFPTTNSFLYHEKYDHHLSSNNAFLSGDCFPTKENLINTSKQDLVEGPGLLEHCNNPFWSEFKIEKPSKKDHHSKIHTSRGPRDRRVRLSIEVAKKFFYLQDLLGFDKASKTLDWLLNKSMISIDELIERKKQSSSSTVTDRSEVFFQLETGTDEQDKARNNECGEGKRKKVKRNYKSGLNQSRAEARARARERTKEKLSKSRSFHVDCCSSNPTLQSSFWNSNDQWQNYDYDHDKIGGSLTEDKISTSYSYQHNIAVSNDSSSKFTGLAKFADLHEQ